MDVKSDRHFTPPTPLLPRHILPSILLLYFQMLESIGHDMHRHLRDLDEDGLSPHVTSGAMRYAWHHAAVASYQGRAHPAPALSLCVFGGRGIF